MTAKPLASSCRREGAHAHHWLIESPEGREFSPGSCKTCGETRHFNNWERDRLTQWGGRRPVRRLPACDCDRCLHEQALADTAAEPPKVNVVQPAPGEAPAASR